MTCFNDRKSKAPLSCVGWKTRCIIFPIISERVSCEHLTRCRHCRSEPRQHWVWREVSHGRSRRQAATSTCHESLAERNLARPLRDARSLVKTPVFMCNVNTINLQTNMFYVSNTRFCIVNVVSLVRLSRQSWRHRTWEIIRQWRHWEWRTVSLYYEVIHQMCWKCWRVKFTMYSTITR